MVLVDYLAVLPEARSRGIGGEVLRQIAEKYPDKRIFLEIESPEESAPNNAQRLKRKSFYLRNGLSETNIHIRIYGNHMELLALSGGVSFEEYRELLKETVGRLFFALLNPQRL
jgi:ribosomal protein S18 acetylase RimI-like enzyme